MYSNIAMLPSTNLVHLLGLLNTPLSDTYPLYDPTPQIKPLASQSLIQIPPLLSQTHLENRQNMSDLSNPIQKRVKFNPEVPVQATQIPMLGTHPIYDNIFPIENSMFQEQDALIFNYHHQLKNIQSFEDPYIAQKLADFQQYKYEAEQLQNLRNLLNKDIFYQQKEQVRSCDLSELVIPPLSSSVHSRKTAQNEDIISNKIQYAIKDLQQKLGFPQHIEIENQPVKSVSSSLTVENHPSLLNSRQLNQHQFNINNLAKNKVSEFKPEKINWNESPNLTGAETNGSCSTSEIWESVSQSDTKCEDETSSIITTNSGKPQKKQQRTANFERQLVCEEKIYQGKSRSSVEISETKKNGRKEKKVKVEIETVKVEANVSQKSEKSQGRTKLNPLFVSKWDMVSDRRRNRWQGSQQTSPSNPEDLKKLAQNKSKSEEDDEDVAETPVGEQHQAEIPGFFENSESDNRVRRCPKLKWNPSNVKLNQLNLYFKKLEEVLECGVNEEKALSLLAKNEHDPKKVYDHIAGREREYVKEFKVRPKRIPEVPLFGDFRVLY